MSLFASESAAKEILVFAKNRLNKLYNPKPYKSEEAAGILKQMGDTLSATPKFDDMVALLKHEQLDDDHCGAQFDLADAEKKN